MTSLPPAGPCPTGKVRLPDEQAARKALRDVRQARGLRRRRHERRYYVCPLCGSYHLTSKKDRYLP